ncbi:hypothetical protein PoB_004068300 [Plakobranchus ocellatus]|uniref:Uncharacterized protein n=1 Tax=Plakobranchus ocellatus TaxID=259542 RepID=A0AAV4B501_9GAST|nr:hypothetical protein PoB_004068300 [Plakobranchus ocellatus]
MKSESARGYIASQVDHRLNTSLHTLKRFRNCSGVETFLLGVYNLVTLVGHHDHFDEALDLEQKMVFKNCRDDDVDSDESDCDDSDNSKEDDDDDGDDVLIVIR